MTSDGQKYQGSNPDEETSGSITRREFLRRATLAAGGVVAANTLLASAGCNTGTPATAPTATPPQVDPMATAQPSPTPIPTATAAPIATTPPTEPPSAAQEPPPTPQPQPDPTGGPALDIELDIEHNPYRAKRSVITRGGVVATSEPLAVEAGLEMLRRGGNAVDAALAAAITLTVVEPTSNGIGSDAFALVWDGNKVHGLNGSGRAPAALTLDAVRSRGHATMPGKGWLPVTVPGAPATWRDLHARFGRLPFADLFVPAIRHAEQGWPVANIVSQGWAYSVPIYTGLKGREFRGWRETFAPRGRAPRSGEKWASPGHASTLRRIAESKAEDFYRGDLASAIAKFAKDTGGLITEGDLAAHTSTWVDPISTNYRGYDVWEIPPNGQGITALIGLNILEGFDLREMKRDTAQAFHPQIESLKLAFADAHRYVADPEFAEVPTARLLDKGYATRRRALIGKRALTPKPGDPYSGGTVYLCAADADGLMVSFIQSNYQGFGSGVVVPGTGISLQNRGNGFSMDPNHPNRLEPGKRPYHTIIPGFLTRQGKAVGPFGVMGGFMQPQGHMQMVVNTIDYRMNPQASLDAPRWQWTSGREVQIESDANPAIIRGLRAMGHTVKVLPATGSFGRGQIIWRLPSGEYIAGSDKRADGYAGAV
ncbi:MAG TPA: gamma-glutamyltransferase family protein [Chloroflexia bacterium]|nr:gamma-glutamyltransferase family protein [Chloroflexia bacterium]